MTTRMLQCGHGVTAVENGRQRPGHDVHFGLQCGHGVTAVENATRWAAVCRASKGFNAATASPPWRTRAVESIDGDHATASMRPRRHRRGEPEARWYRSGKPY